jgi:hypothetical protein
MNNNKLIAEFMGMDSFKDSLASLHQGKINVDVDVYEQAQYHTSWDWLMPVVQKIFGLAVADENIELFYDVQTHIPDKTATYNAVVEFIKTYNDGQRENN